MEGRKGVWLRKRKNTNKSREVYENRQFEKGVWLKNKRRAEFTKMGGVMGDGCGLGRRETDVMWAEEGSRGRSTLLLNGNVWLRGVAMVMETATDFGRGIGSVASKMTVTA